MGHSNPELCIASSWKYRIYFSNVRFDVTLKLLPEKILAIAAIRKLNITPGPAILLATIPATKYIPVPQHDPTPSDVRSSVVKHF